MNREELRKVAAELGISGRSKMSKDELSDAIFKHPDNPLSVTKSGDVTRRVDREIRDEYRKVNFAERMGTGPGPGNITHDTPLMDRVGPDAVVTDIDGVLTIDDMANTGRVFITDTNTPAPGEAMDISGWIEVGYTDAEGFSESVSDDRRVYGMVQGVALFGRPKVKAARSLLSQRYGMAGRGMGAKHFVGLTSKPGVHHGGVNKDAIKPLSYGDRVRHYAKQNGKPGSVGEIYVLTPRQWRRSEKKQRAGYPIPLTGSPFKAERYV